MNELKSNIKYETTTLSGDTHYYQPDTFTVMPINNWLFTTRIYTNKKR